MAGAWHFGTGGSEGLQMVFLRHVLNEHIKVTELTWAAYNESLLEIILQRGYSILILYILQCSK